MNAVFARWPFVRFEIFTLVPQWFFDNSLKAPYSYHAESTDVGLVQVSPLHFDLEKTIDALEDFLPFDEQRLERLTAEICAADCLLVISDISPLGTAVAKYAGIDALLVENFTWDWIYEAYVSSAPRFDEYIDRMRKYNTDISLRIQAAPVCSSPPVNINGEHFCTPPISRAPVTRSRHIREALEIGENEKMVLITNGGIAANLPVGLLEGIDNDICFVNPGASMNLPATGRRKNNVIFLPQNSVFYHPDLVHAADAVISKVGYSTLAEIYHAGVPYGFIPRPDFRESPVLEAFIGENMAGLEITESEFNSGAWLKKLFKLLQMPVRKKKEPNGADVAAELICNFLSCEKEILEVVNTEGCVVGAAPRKCVHGNNELLHQVIHVLVFDKDDRLLLQKRSLNKRVAPGRWDTSVGGHVDCGESIETAMHREMEEELGIRPKSLQYAYQYIHSNDFESELVFTYTCQYEGLVVFNPEEIDAVKFWTKKEIEESFGKGILSDNFEDEFRRYRQWKMSL